jgi:hypothetical protein
VKSRTNFADQLALSVGPGAVGEQDDCDPRIQVDPERASAESKVAD